MCEPATIALAIAAVASAGTAVVSHQNASAAAKQQQDAINREEALQQADLIRQRDQQFAADSAEVNAHARQAAKEAALFDVVTGEYGGGNTTSRTATIGSINTGEQLATLADNSKTAAGENSFRSFSLASQAASRLGAIQRPSSLGTGLQIVGSAASAYGSYQGHQGAIKQAKTASKP